MSIAVSRESISKLMGELVETFPLESEGRSSISDFGKLLFTEGQSEHGVKPSTDPKTAGPGTKRVYTEIKGIPRQKQHDIMKVKDKAMPKRWTSEEDEKLREAVGRHGERNWKSIAEEVPGRNHTQCLQRWTKVLAPGLVKGHWRPDEDELLKELVAEGRKNWGQVATRIPGRTSKQCRERWYNHLDPTIIRGEYSAEEDRMILEAQAQLGNRWSAIAAMLPGRTEDAVKIRWKSLCRVRKGHGRRGQADKDKKSIMGHMLPPSSGFTGMIKGDEVASFSMQSQPMMRLMSGQVVPSMSMSNSQHGIFNGLGRGGVMYPSDMSDGGYDPTMVHFRKPPMQQHLVTDSFGHTLPHPGPLHDTNGQNFDRPTLMMGIPSNGLIHSQDNYQGHSSVYPSSLTSNIYSTGSPMSSGGLENTQMYGNVSRLRPGEVLYSGSQLSPHQPQQISPSSLPHIIPYSYGLSAPSRNDSSSPHSSNNPLNNPAVAFAHRHLQRQYSDRMEPVPHQIPHQMSPHSSVPPAASDRSNLKQTPVLSQPKQLKRSASDGAKDKNESETEKTTRIRASSAQESLSTTTTPPSKDAKTSIVGNPVAAFLQKQQKNTNDDPTKTNETPQKPFNPAAAFAQRFKAEQKPPISRSSSAGSTKSNDDTADEDDDENAKINEPSLKKVKPRLSIDAARASVVRRLRNSGNDGSLAGRGSLDIFLNEIGDVGRLSDLKMEEFQTLDELWRVSGDMGRLSL